MRTEATFIYLFRALLTHFSLFCAEIAYNVNKQQKTSNFTNSVCDQDTNSQGKQV